jgi:hypothetical protein
MLRILDQGAETRLHRLINYKNTKNLMFYAGGPQQVTEYVSRNVQKFCLPLAFFDNDASYVRLGGGHTAP